jgi:hypothetical protein
MLLRKLLGFQRFRRLGATMPSIKYARTVMLNPDLVLLETSKHAELLWQHEILRYKGLPVPGVLTAEESAQQKQSSFLRWVQNCWMDVPANPRQKRVAVS